VLNAQGDNCELQTQTAFSGLAHDDAGDMKKRVDASLAKLKTAPIAAPPATKSEEPAK
jgi:hypothetical protein